MYKQGIFTIEENRPLTASVYRMVLAGDTRYITAPGQFINIALEGNLRRPISVRDYDSRTVTIIYKVVGQGTAQMAKIAAGGDAGCAHRPGQRLHDASLWHHALLIGRWRRRAAPLQLVPSALRAAGQQVTVILGFNTADEVFYAEEFAALGAEVRITTVDGSVGDQGLRDGCHFRQQYDYFLYLRCQLPMLRAVYDRSATTGQFSFEERMGCGFGACMGCSCKTKYGNKRICKDGPVLDKGGDRYGRHCV